jgi:hypothetical protein
MQAPLELATHLHQDGRAEPDYCDDPDTLLLKLETAIGADRTDGGALWCQPDRFSDVDGARILRVSCRLPSDGACQDHYMGQLWAERFDNGTRNYVLRGYGWVRRACPTGKTYSVGDIRDVSHDTSAAFDSIVAPCKTN